MKFRLLYEGHLSGNHSTKEKKHEIRAKIHPQIKSLWELKPLDNFRNLLNPQDQESVVIDRGPYKYVPLINSHMSLRGELDILLLRPFSPGKIIREHGDIDNQIKTLIDGLRVPHSTQELTGLEYININDGFIFTLFEDDSLLSGFSVSTDRLLNENDKEKALAIITVYVRASQSTIDNLELTRGHSI